MKYLLTITTLLLSNVACLVGETFTLEPSIHAVDASVSAVSAKALWGTIRVEAVPGNELRIEASAEGERSTGPAKDQGPVDGQVWIEVIEREGVLEVVPRSELEGFWGIDLRLLVPERLAVELVMERGGEISVNGISGTIDIVNWNGSIQGHGLRGAALVHARNGSIDLQFEAVPERSPMSFSSLNGSVDVTLPPLVRASVWGRTANGNLESSFGPVETDFEPGDSEFTRKAPRTHTASLNGGGPSYSFYSANGSIYLREGELSR